MMSNSALTLGTGTSGTNATLTLNSGSTDSPSYDNSAILIERGGTYHGVISTGSWYGAGNPSLNSLIINSSTDSLYLCVGNNTGLIINTSLQVAFPGLTTTASSPNAYLDPGANNTMYVSTSSARYKMDVEAFDHVTSGPIIDALMPIKYRSRAPADDPAQVHYGLLAEDVADVEPALTQWTPAKRVDSKYLPESCENIESYLSKYVKDGRVPNGVQYDRIVVLLLAEVKSLRRRLEAAGIH